MGCLEKNCQHTDYESIISHCAQQNIKLTPLREAVLKIVSRAEKPMTAYAILDELRHAKPKAQVMSVYRILNFLLDNELIHRIESLNAFILCHHMEAHGHLTQWLICTQCGNVTECDLPVFKQSVDTLAAQTGFSVTAPIIEITGICSSCQTAP